MTPADPATEPIPAAVVWQPRPVHHSGPLPVLRTVITGQALPPGPFAERRDLDRPWPVWGATGGYRITCDGPGGGTDDKPPCGKVFDHPEPAREDALTGYLRHAAMQAGWSLDGDGCLLCPDCQETARTRHAETAAALGSAAEDRDRWIAMSVEGLRPADAGIYSRPMRFEIALDEIRIRARDAAEAETGTGQAVAA